MEDHILQPILVKLSDLLLEEPSETNHFGNMFIKLIISLNQPICSLKNKFKYINLITCSLKNQLKPTLTT